MTDRPPGEYPFYTFSPADTLGLLFIADPVSQLDLKNVTYNAFNFPIVQYKMGLLLQELNRIENFSPAELGLQTHHESYFMRLFNRQSLCSTQ